MSLETWLAYVLASSVLLLIPGPTILTVIGYSLSHGRRAKLPLIAAVALGDSTALALSLAGLGVLLAASAAWFSLLKTLGGLYLIYLGLRLWQAQPATAQQPRADEAGWRLFWHTYLVTALNPKGMVFFVAFLPQFVSPTADAGGQLWILAVTFVVLATLNASAYALFAGAAQRLLSSERSRRGFHRCGGALMITAGVWALLSKRSAVAV